MRSATVRTLIAVGLGIGSVAGCRQPAPSAPLSIRPLGEHATLRLSVRLAKPAAGVYRTQYLRMTTWERAVATASGPGLAAAVTTEANASVDPVTGARSASLSFVLPPGGGYRIAVELQGRDPRGVFQVIARGAQDGVVAAGQPPPLELALAPTAESQPTADPVAAPVVGTLVESYPAPGPGGRFRNLLGITIDSQGRLYVCDDVLEPRIRRVAPDAAGRLTLVTLAGGRTSAHVDGPGATARFRVANHLVCDPDGNLYVTDITSHAVRKLSPDGAGGWTVSTIAGTGVAGWADGPGPQAQFSEPRGLARDAAGNLYVTEYTTGRLRKLTPDGAGGWVVSTLAGDGTPGFADGPAATARFNQPSAIRVDDATEPPSFWVADSGNYRIRRVAPDGDGVYQVTTLAGDGTSGYLDGPAATAQFKQPYDVAPDGRGGLLVTDYADHRLRRIAPDGAGGWQVTTAAGDGTTGLVDGIGAAARFNRPKAMVPGPEGVVYMTDETNVAIRKVTVDEAGVATVSTHFGDGTAGKTDGPMRSSPFVRPHGCAMGPDGVLYYTDSLRHSIFALVPDGTGGATSRLVAGSGTAGFADGTGAAASFNRPDYLTVDPSGNLIVAEAFGNRIRKLTPDGAGNWVASTIAGTGVAGHIDGPGAGARFYFPNGIALDAAGRIFIAEAVTNVIRRLDPDGAGGYNVTTIAGGGPAWVDGPGPDARFSTPHGLAVAPDGAIYVADALNHCVRKLTPDGAGGYVVSTIAGGGVSGYVDGPGPSARFSNPRGLALDGAGRLWIGDVANQRIRLLTPQADGSWVVGTVAGSGVAAFADGPAATAAFWGPLGLAVAADGTAYVVDSGSRWIRRIRPTPS